MCRCGEDNQLRVQQSLSIMEMLINSGYELQFISSVLFCFESGMGIGDAINHALEVKK